MNAYEIIDKYYPKGSLGAEILIAHSELVTKKAVEIAERIPQLNPDIPFIREAAMLHDIGVFKTHAPDIGCNGDLHYVCHGYIGREILEDLGFGRHGLVCERHILCGNTAEDIAKLDIPVPVRDALPLSIEEKIICFADKFYSKSMKSGGKEKEISRIRKGMERFGQAQVDRFDEMYKMFGA